MQEFVRQPGNLFVDPCPRQTGKGPFLRALSNDDAPVQVNSAAYAQLLVAEIIPRLLLDCKAMLRPPPFDLRRKNMNGSGEATDFKGLASLLLRGESADVSLFIDARLGEGVTIEALLAEFLAPAARQLGTLWEADECDFVDVTIGLHRLHEAVRRLCRRRRLPTLRGRERARPPTSCPGRNASTRPRNRAWFFSFGRLER